MPRPLLEKNLYRKASAEYELNNYESCEKVCKDLLSEFPSNAAGKQLLLTVERDLAQEKKSEKATYTKLFHRLDEENRVLS